MDVEEGMKVCPNCDGEGTQLAVRCDYPAAYCCGGCTVDEECDTCRGEGVVEDEDWEGEERSEQ